MLTSLVPSVALSARTPEQLEIDVTQYNPTDPDPGTATGASLEFRFPDGSKATATASVANASTGSVSVLHPWAAADLPMVGEYVVIALLTLPGGVYKTSARTFKVRDDYDSRGPAQGPCRVATVLA